MALRSCGAAQRPRRAGWMPGPRAPSPPTAIPHLLRGLSRGQAARKPGWLAPSGSQRQRPGGAGRFAAPSGHDPCSRATSSASPSAKDTASAHVAAAPARLPRTGPRRARACACARAIGFCTSVFTQLDSFARVALTTLTYVEPN